MHTEKKAYELGQIIAFHNAGLIGQEKVGMLLEKVAKGNPPWEAAWDAEWSAKQKLHNAEENARHAEERARNKAHPPRKHVADTYENPVEVDWDAKREALKKELRAESDKRRDTATRKAFRDARATNQAARESSEAVSGTEDVFKNLGKHKGKIIGGTLGAGALLGGTIGAGLGSWSDEPGSVARGGMTGMGAGAGTGAGLLGSGALMSSILKSHAAAEAAGKAPGGMYGRGIAALALPIAGMFGGGALGHWAGNKATGHTDTAAPRR